MVSIASPKGLIIAFGIAALQACTINVPITIPEVSTTPFERSDRTINLALEDGLAVSHQVSQGGLPLKVSYDNKPLNSQFFFDNLRAEMTARNMNVQVASDSDHTLQVSDFSILHHRVSGFSPMVTLSTVSADLETPAGTQRITSFIRRAKVPVWSMDEIVDPCFNQSIQILVREIAAKINQELFDTSLDDETVQSLIAKINQSSDNNTFLDVLELGYSNNALAKPVLFELSSHDDE